MSHDAERLPAITVHGRFQPPVHVNHWTYINDAFNLADHVTILITNPYLDEATQKEAAHRAAAENNPFTYDERVFMFNALLKRQGIGKDRYDIRPFDITDPASFDTLDPSVPNLVNSYSEWSYKKADMFREHGLKVIQTERQKSVPVSGTEIRELLASHRGYSDNELRKLLVDNGFLPGAVPGLLEVLAKRKEH